MSLSVEAEVFSAFSPVTSMTSGLHVYDFIGTATRVSYKRGWAKHAIPAGRNVTPRIPVKNEHYLDWIALLRAVARAKGVFRMAELGAGWAPWLVCAAGAARQRPEITAVELLGVEADPTHFGWMRQHFADNGLNPESHTLIHGAVAGQHGEATFPVIESPDEDYGSSIAAAARAARTITVPAYSLSFLLGHFSGPVDFLHVDIQGAEYEAFPPSMSAISEKVRSLMVGTHISQTLHDEFVEELRIAGWREVLNLSRNRAHLTPWGEIEIGDGFLLFDNPRFD